MVTTMAFIQIRFLAVFIFLFGFFNVYLIAVPLKDKNGNYHLESFEPIIPKKYEDVTSLKFPSNADIELDFTGFKEGSTIGPDGGEVYRWKEGLYKWNFSDGGELMFWNTSNWMITKDEFRFHVHTDNGRNLPKNFSLLYPDGSVLNQVYHKGFQTLFYSYENRNAKLFFQIFPMQMFTSQFKIGKRFHFYFEPEHEAWIDAFLEGDAYDRFEKHIKEIGYTSSNQIPVVFFKNENQFRNYVNIPNANCAGGRGGIFGISFCNLEPLQGYIGTNEEEREKSKAVHHTHMIYHEWGHHLQQVECSIVRKDQQYPNQIFSAWFNEGMAEYLGYIGSSKKRGNDRILFFEKYVLEGKSPILSKEDPYLVGGQLFRYIAENYGDKSILNLWSNSCKGEKEDVLIKNLTGRSPQELLNTYFKEISKFKTEPMRTEFMKATLEDWSRDVMILKFVHRNPELPNLEDPTVKPKLKQAFLLDIDSIRGKLEGQFTNSRNEQIYIFKDGTYTIKGPDYNATFYQNQTVVFQSKDQQITEWPNGNITWKDSKGNTYNF
jgi:hypothetical protein